MARWDETGTGAEGAERPTAAEALGRDRLLARSGAREAGREARGSLAGAELGASRMLLDTPEFLEAVGQATEAARGRGRPARAARAARGSAPEGGDAAEGAGELALGASGGGRPSPAGAATAEDGAPAGGGARSGGGSRARAIGRTLADTAAWLEEGRALAETQVRLTGGDWTRAQGWAGGLAWRVGEGATGAETTGAETAGAAEQRGAAGRGDGAAEEATVAERVARRVEPERALPIELAAVLGELRATARQVRDLGAAEGPAEGRAEARGERGAREREEEAARAAREARDGLRLRAAGLVVVAGEVIRWHRERTPRGPRGDGVGLPVGALADAIEDLAVLHAQVSPAPERRARGSGAEAAPTRGRRAGGGATAAAEGAGESGVPRTPIALGVLARDARVLTERGFLRSEELPDAFQVAYDRAWHTDAKTRTATGGFTGGLRDRAAREGSPALLTVLAASSDGRNRGVAGIAADTPGPVYDQLIYDVSKDVLLDVVQSPQFTQSHAYAMLETKLAAQTAAVMLEGRVDMGIRVLATRQAIAHEGVRPNDVLTFLTRKAGHPDVPDALWRDFVLELKRRVYMARVHGTPKEREVIESCAESTTRQFVDEVLRSYWKAVREVESARAAGAAEGDLGGPTGGTQDAVTGGAAREAGSAPGGTAAPGGKPPAGAATAYLAAHDFLQDPQILDVMVEGARSPEALMTMLRYCVEGNLPVSKKLVVKVFNHADPRVREEGVRLMPNMDEEGVASLAADVEQEVAADYAAVKDQVFSHVIPADYEGIEGEARRLSRMHHYFRAARTVPVDTLVDVYVGAARNDPRTIPEAFRYATMMQRYAGRVTGMGRRGDGDGGGEEERARALPPVGSYRQGELFEPPRRHAPAGGDAGPAVQLGR